ncbi:sulfite exporter TauE/SafE family protein [Campylobacter geochelonis]|uniref:Probable membrane transporter protein n=1 Tax=Campylobacter geochelonis TaxID=1780362 RepID=A0A128EE87_9BACT|nr:sulfite exporter TauE/SafE family protein [Campylobacter geochelonis]QKF70728.1 sulfite exporter TauE/SafE family protein [Campylobacter geochelonis]CZE47249.1 Sulfite exporter TauE/SafE [Campylobacter geochelonis]CZE49426.1 Sulfite exporter TauE/SafE [Campylobacter geochelonis]CZE50498.1 Sulfite exporter TauE/SafE [Campylobacter geochelonis]
MFQTYAILAICFISAFFHSLSGFGFPLIATPLLFMVASPKEAILLTLFPTLFMNLISIWGIKNAFLVLKKYIILSLFIIVGSYAGSYILITYPSDIYKVLLSIIIILYLLKDKIHLNFTTFLEKHKMVGLACFGLVAGVVGGLVNVMLVVIVILILELKLDKNDSIVVMNFSFLTSKLTQIATFFSHGEIGKSEFLYGMMAVGACIAAVYISRKIVKPLSEQTFRKFLKWVMILFAILLLVQYFAKFI